jgi:tRNA pseudouridine55 synthase
MTGIICINKPKDITSFGVVAKVRGILREKKCGHTGTLDPMATGVLPVMLGGATRFLDYLPTTDKGYRAGFILGKTTDTLDITGRVLTEAEVNVSEQDIKAVLPSFTGKIQQLPPMYSAKSVDGKRLYELAREGIEVERKPCEVEIKNLELLRCENGEYFIDVFCSKGTYIRSLIDDIGRALGCGAVMTSLERTYASGFSIEDCVTLEELQSRRDEGRDFDDLIFCVEDLYRSYLKVSVSEAQARRFSNGGELDIKRIRKAPPAGETVCVYFENEFLGLGCNDGESLRIVRLYRK